MEKSYGTRPTGRKLTSLRSKIYNMFKSGDMELAKLGRRMCHIYRISYYVRIKEDYYPQFLPSAGVNIPNRGTVLGFKKRCTLSRFAISKHAIDPNLGYRWYFIKLYKRRQNGTGNNRKNLLHI